MELSAEFPVYSRKLEISRGEGVWLFDAEGRRYMDLYGGHAVVSFGYADAGLVETLRRASQEIFFQSNSVEIRSRRVAASSLSQIVPGGPWRCLFVNSGAEANENALRLAFRAKVRPKIAAIRGAFHGRTAAAAAVTEGNIVWYGFPQKPFETVWLDPADASTLEMLDETVSAVIVEPVQGVAGARDLSHDFLSRLQARANEVGALVIADEVQSGMGRTGAVCAFQEAGLRPNIVTLGKAIAGGFPAGATLAKPELVDDLPIGSFGTTFGGGPIACALISEVACRVMDPDLMANVRRLGERLRQESLGRRVLATSGKGFLIGLRVEGGAKQLQSELLEAGIIVGDAKDPQVVRLLPPLILQDEHVDEFLATLKRLGN